MCTPVNACMTLPKHVMYKAGMYGIKCDVGSCSPVRCARNNAIVAQCCLHMRVYADICIHVFGTFHAQLIGDNQNQILRYCRSSGFALHLNFHMTSFNLPPTIPRSFMAIPASAASFAYFGPNVFGHANLPESFREASLSAHFLPTFCDCSPTHHLQE